MTGPLAPGMNIAEDLKIRGFRVLYRQDAVNHCPSCGRTHWIVGRMSAECVFCATAVILEHSAA